jgi:Ca2+-binding RTX toxin-like protein
MDTRLIRRGSRASLAVAVACLWACALVPASALARTDGKLYVPTAPTGESQCLTVSAETGCTQSSGLAGNGDVTVSPSGKTIYVTGSGTGDVSISAYARDPATGAIGAKINCVSVDGSGGCATDINVMPHHYVGVSSNGRTLYASTDANGGGILAFSLDPATGAIGAEISCVTTGHGSQNQCVAVPSLSGARTGLTLTDKNFFLESGVPGDSRVTRLAIASDGKLSLAQCLTSGAAAGGCTSAPNLPYGGMTVSPSQNRLIIGGEINQNNNPANARVSGYSLAADGTIGALTWCMNFPGASGICTAGDARLIYINQVAATGTSLYLVAYQPNFSHLVGLDLPADGTAPTIVSCYGASELNGPCAAGSGTDFQQAVISPRGNSIFVTSATGGDVSAFPIAAHGVISARRNCIEAAQAEAACDDGPNPSFANSGGIAISPDGNSIYALGTKNGTTNDGVQWLGVESPPTCPNASVTVDAGVPASIPLTCLDTDGDTVTRQITTVPAHGSVGAVAGDSVSYTADAAYTGADSLGFRGDDPDDTGLPATISIFVNHAPACQDVARTVDAGQSVTVPLTCTDPNTGDTLTFSTASQPALGTLSAVDQAARTVTYTAGTVAGDDTFTYKANDGRVDSNPVGKITIRVNVAPKCVAVAGTVAPGATVTLPLTCTDTNGDTLKRTIVTQPAIGLLGPVNDAGGTINYLAPAGGSRITSFTFKASDGRLESAVATATVAIVAPTVPPPPALKKGACANVRNGTRGKDTITGTIAGDRIHGLAGNDLIRALPGADCLFGDAGSDVLSGDAGNDRLDGGAGNDRLLGGPGNDRETGDAGRDILEGATGTDYLDGGASTDQVRGGLGNDTVKGGAGNDFMSGGPGKDKIYGGPGNDKIDSRDKTRDVVDCGPGKDTVTADKVDVVKHCERVGRR